jgi:hypothetical protein
VLEHVHLHLHTAHEVDTALRSLHTLPLPMADVHIALGELLCPLRSVTYLLHVFVYWTL